MAVQMNLTVANDIYSDIEKTRKEAGSYRSEFCEIIMRLGIREFKKKKLISMFVETGA